MNWKTHHYLKKALAKLLQKEIAKRVQISLEEVYSFLGPTPSLEKGHLAFACFGLAKALKSSPQKIASELAKSWPKSEGIEKLSPEGPYLNFFFEDNFFTL